MNGVRASAAWLSLTAGLFWAEAAIGQQTLPVEPPKWPVPPASSSLTLPSPTAAPSGRVLTAPSPSSVPLAELPERVRGKVRSIVEQATLSARGPSEEFNGKLAVYQWLMDHPDHASRAWRRLGTPCLEITDRGNGWFGWAEEHGSDVSWQTIYSDAHVRVWYAQGSVRPGVLFPSVPVRVVAVMHYDEHADAQGRTRLQQHADLFMQTDSKTMAVVLRLIGPSLPAVTEQCVGQLELFFSALTSYLARHPEQAQELLR
jgi:hypothetical protein